MAAANGLGWTFDTVAATYEKMRPGYAPALYRTIFDWIPIGPESRVLEIGSGGGQATGPMLQTGCSLTAVEYGPRFSGLLREKFAAYPSFSLITGKFEETDLPMGQFDLVFAASAFHWIPEEIGYPKVFDLLKSGGVFARFANRPYRDKYNPALSREIDEIYEEYYYTFHKKQRQPLVEFSRADAAALAAIPERYGFAETGHALFHRDRVFTAEEYVQLLGTYSDHIAIDEPIRFRFFGRIADAIRRHGGTITVCDTMDLELARKP